MNTYKQDLTAHTKVVAPPQSFDIRVGGKTVKLHAIQSGEVAVKANFYEKKGPGPLSKLNILLGNAYTPYLPIWVWVIEHPEGSVLIDTGERHLANDLNKHLANESWMLRFQFMHAARFDVLREQEVDLQLKQLGIQTADIAKIVLTHLHLDHTDGLVHFPKTEVLVSKHEMRTAKNTMPTTYPKGLKMKGVDLKCGDFQYFNRVAPLSASGDLWLVETPGHTHGHAAVLWKTDEFDIIFAGDVTYDQNQLLQGTLAGVHSDFAASRKTMRNILAHASKFPTLYLPSHDVNALNNLRQRRFLS